MRFGIWNVKSLYRSGSLTTVAKELEGYKLDLVGVKEVKWDQEGIQRAGGYTFLNGKGNENHQLGTGVFLHLRIVTAVKRLELLVTGCRIQR